MIPPHFMSRLQLFNHMEYFHETSDFKNLFELNVLQAQYTDFLYNLPVYDPVVS